MVEKSEKVVLSMGTPQQRGRTEQQDVSKMTVVELKRALEAMQVEFTREDKKATLVALFKAHASPPSLSRNNSGDGSPHLSRTRSVSIGGDPDTPTTKLSKVEQQTLAAEDPTKLFYHIVRAIKDQTHIEIIKNMMHDDPLIAWDRGPVDELPIHFACLCRNIPLMDWFIEHDEALAISQYEGTIYTGENLLHICIVNKDHNQAKKLGRRFPALLSQRATGSFFTEGKELEKGSYITPCYYGEFPLFFAACTNQPELFTHLLNFLPEQLFWQDSKGNNLLHMCVVHELIDMYDHICIAWEKAVSEGRTGGREQLWDQYNNSHKSVLVYAAERGSEKMFVHILECSKVIQWSYGPVTCVRYPLRHLDLNPGTLEGALEVIVSAEHNQLMSCDIVVDLITRKWETFAYKYFKDKFYWALFFMFLLTTSIVFRKAGLDENHYGLHLHYSHTWHKHTSNTVTAILTGNIGTWNSTLPAFPHYSNVTFEANNAISGGDCSWHLEAENKGILGEISLLVGKISTCIIASLPFGEHSEFANESMKTCLIALLDMSVVYIAYRKAKREWKEMVKDKLGYFVCSGAQFVENICSVFTYGGVLFAALLRCLPGCFSAHYEDLILSVVSISGWMYFLYFLLGYPQTGPLVIMMAKMLKNDVFVITIIYFVFVLGFSMAFYIEFNEVGWGKLVHHIKTCFLALLGETNWDDYQALTQHPWISTALMTGYVFVMTIMLVNLLVAMMGDTYSKIIDQNKMIWQLEKTRIIFSIENELSYNERQEALKDYQMDIKGQKWMQCYEVNEKFYHQKWCKCRILFSRCPKCNPTGFKREDAEETNILPHAGNAIAAIAAIVAVAEDNIAARNEDKVKENKKV